MVRITSSGETRRLAMVFALLLFFACPSYGQFRIAVGINQMAPDEARVVINSPGPRLRCEGLFGPSSLITLHPDEWARFIAKTGPYRIISEDVVGFSEAPAREWGHWKNVIGREPSQGMVYSELGGLVFPMNGEWTLSAIPGFVEYPNVPRTYWPQYNAWFPSVWDTCIDRPLVDNYVRVTGRGRALLLCRDFNDRPSYGPGYYPAPYRSHLIDGLRHPDVVGAVFEIETNIGYLNARIPNGLGPDRNIAEGIRAVLARDKDCYLLLSPGTPNGRPYADRVRAVVTELERQGVPFNNRRLWVVVACYNRANSNTGFLVDGWGSNSVEAALQWLRNYRN